jgi:hypothetical protein
MLAFGTLGFIFSFSERKKNRISLGGKIGFHFLLHRADSDALYVVPGLFVPELKKADDSLRDHLFLIIGFPALPRNSLPQK